MAIQKINLGTAPTGAGGDTQRSANTKINANFSNPDHAASRVVGEQEGNVMEVGAFGLGGKLSVHTSTELPPTGFYYLPGDHLRFNGGSFVLDVQYTASGTRAFRLSNTPYTNRFYLHGGMQHGNILQDGVEIRHSGNTTVDSNGYVKSSSPVLRVYSDKITGNNDGEKMGAKFTKNGIGDYTVSNTTGLAENGWYITLPNDLNGNPKVAVELKETDGVVSLKTYKRIFNMETFAFGPDLDKPVDIPDGRWIDLRFNDLPTNEVADEPIE